MMISVAGRLDDKCSDYVWSLDHLDAALHISNKYDKIMTSNSNLN